MLNRVMEVQVSDARLNGVHRGGQQKFTSNIAVQ
jgi:hypothetical protein